MKFSGFLLEKINIILLNLFLSILLSIYLHVLENSFSEIIIIILCQFIILIVVFVIEFFYSLKKYNYIQNCFKHLDKKYLITEMLMKPETQLENIYYEMLKQGNKSMAEEVLKANRGKKAYKEYIEEWIHEIKTPIAAIDLICKNSPTGENKKIQRELENIHYHVEQVLYYARSEAVERDYFIKEFKISDAIQTALLNNRSSILENSIKLSVEETEAIICTDEKWLVFILNQIIINSIKYRKANNRKLKISKIEEPMMKEPITIEGMMNEPISKNAMLEEPMMIELKVDDSKNNNPVISIYTEKMNKGITLIIEDNGKGIDQGDLPRIFEKGFTGHVRSNSKSTGIGLYLCKKLCDKLGLTIEAESILNEFTRIKINIPIGDYHKMNNQ